MPSHHERRTLPYRCDQMFALVADVDHYADFLPWVTATRIRKRSQGHLLADMVVGYKFIRETFTSDVTLQPDRLIEVEYVSGPLKDLKNRWEFKPVEGGCEVDFHVSFEFRSRMLQRISEMFFNEVIRRMVGSFEAEARRRFGQPSSAPDPSPAPTAA